MSRRRSPEFRSSAIEEVIKLCAKTELVLPVRAMESRLRNTGVIVLQLPGNAAPKIRKRAGAECSLAWGSQ